MISPKRLCWVFALLLCCRALPAGELQFSPAIPVVGDRIVLSLDEYLTNDSRVTWSYQQPGEDQRHEIATSDGFPEFVATRSGAIVVHCEIKKADNTRKRLQRIIAVEVKSDGPRSITAPQPAYDRQLAKQRALDERLESSYDVAKKISAALREYRVYLDDLQFQEHARQVAEIYQRGAEYFLKIGQEPHLQNKLDATQLLIQELDVFRKTMPPGSLAETAWAKFFRSVTNLYVSLYREHVDEFSAAAAHAAFFKNVASGIEVGRQEDEEYFDNLKTYQSYMDRTAGANAPSGNESDNCWRILWGH